MNWHKVSVVVSIAMALTLIGLGTWANALYMFAGFFIGRLLGVLFAGPGRS